MKSPYAKALMSIDGAPGVSGGVTVAGSNVIQLTGQNTTSWITQLWEIYEYPTGFACPAGWFNNAGVYQSNAVIPPSFTLPSNATWGKFFIRLTVNEGLLNGIFAGPDSDQPLVDESSALSILSARGIIDIGFLEANQFDPLEQWGELKKNLRTIDIGLAGLGGGGTVPSGTGFRHVTSGVEDGTAKKVVLSASADVTVPGSDKSVLINDGGVVGAPSTLKFDKTLESLSAGTGAVASGQNSVAFGLNCSATGTYSGAIGQGCTASNAGTFAAGESCTASAPNAITLGFASTASGTYSQTLGSYCSATAAGAVCVGLNAAAIRPGEFTHGSGHSGAQHSRLQLYRDLNGASGILQTYGGGVFSIETDAVYAMEVRVLAAKNDGTVCAQEKYELTVSGHGGAASIVGITPTLVQPAGGLSAIGASIAFSTPGGLELRLSADPGASHIRFVADLEYSELYNLTGP